jgi:hypothetical protein
MFSTGARIANGPSGRPPAARYAARSLAYFRAKVLTSHAPALSSLALLDVAGLVLALGHLISSDVIGHVSGS